MKGRGDGVSLSAAIKGVADDLEGAPMSIGRLLVATALGASVLIGTAPSFANDCNNEPGDVNVAGIAGVDHPGSNGYYFACVGGGNYGVHVKTGSTGTCAELIVNTQEIGGC